MDKNTKSDSGSSANPKQGEHEKEHLTIIVKVLKTKDKEKILKSSREK